MKSSTLTLFLSILLSSQLSFGFGSDQFFLNSKELLEKYPSISETSNREEKKEILCPFWRLIERSGALDLVNKAKNSDVIVSISQIIKNAEEFGCKKLGCGAVASLVSAGQATYRNTTKLFHVNISKLHRARGVAHDCGFTFAKGESVVSDVVRANTLERLQEISSQNKVIGQLSQDDLMKVKLEICKAQGVEISKAGSVEVGLIYKYLGGTDRGYVEYDDVVRLFHAEMPETKALQGI